MLRPDAPTHFQPNRSNSSRACPKPTETATFSKPNKVTVLANVTKAVAALRGSACRSVRYMSVFVSATLIPRPNRPPSNHQLLRTMREMSAALERRNGLIGRQFHLSFDTRFERMPRQITFALAAAGKDSLMNCNVLDLDGGIIEQRELLRTCQPKILPLRDWGSAIRLGCSFGRFRRFETAYADAVGQVTDHEPAINFVGSGDFHHVSLALVRRIARPITLVVLDNHPDWMRCVPLLHCGTWLYHAAQLPHVKKVFHIGGGVDFDNYYLPLAPKRLLLEKKIVTFPAVRRFRNGVWNRIATDPVREQPDEPASASRLAELFAEHRDDLSRHPVYISIDKDVLKADDAVVNWDSGVLTIAEVLQIVRTLIEMSGSAVAGIDIVGDWSPVRVNGLLRRLFHWTMHPPLGIDPERARKTNQRVNLQLVQSILDALQCGSPAVSHAS